MRDYRTHRPGTYQEMTSGFRWEVPASYNLAADVLDKHEPDRPAMHFLSDEGRDERWSFGDMRRLTDRTANALQQVVLNLVTNAAQAMPSGGDITITTTLDDGKVRLVVADTGPGIAPEHLSHIFEPFFTTKPSGTGLGLSVTYGILNDHNATVDVDSVPGQGARFVLTFPVADARA